LRQLADRGDAGLGQPGHGHWSHPPHQLDRQVVQESQLGRRIDDDQAIRFGDLGGDLRQVFGARHTDGNRQPQLVPHARPDAGGDVGGRAEQPHRGGDVRERLVDGDPFDVRREVGQHGDRRIAQALVGAEVAAGEDQIRAELARPAPRHAAPHAEGARLVRGGEHDPAANGNGPAA
jgi:hypothetical protein